ncbi:hypothetical protein NRB15_15580 [Pseudomonas alliivorans]|uniref:hypothetical protein n=1 Tax=Pseudomonas alliivorans TaxID=2810613 RepID=UPI00211C2974|nr:hypothetical protein [Pseudomonas alliivorans]MCQ9471756.1 hypothetical protein [Pseudomonas alliivorans]
MDGLVSYEPVPGGKFVEFWDMRALIVPHAAQNTCVTRSDGKQSSAGLHAHAE